MNALQLKAFNALVSDHQDSLYNVAFHAIGDEESAVVTTQAAIQTAYQTLGSLQTSSIRLWLLRSLVMQCRKYYRNRTNPPQKQPLDLQSCLASLPLELCLVITLVDLEGLDYDQAAAVLNEPRRQVIKRLAQARQKLVENMPVH